MYHCLPLIQTSILNKAYKQELGIFHIFCIFHEEIRIADIAQNTLFFTNI